MEEKGYQKTMNEEETTEDFLNHIRGLIDYWENDVEGKTIKERLEGLAFSILVVIDGESMQPPCVLRPLVSSPNGDEWLDIGHDISGNLHNLFYKKEE